MSNQLINQSTNQSINANVNRRLKKTSNLSLLTYIHNTILRFFPIALQHTYSHSKKKLRKKRKKETERKKKEERMIDH